jgi:hypothetical protein
MTNVIYNHKKYEQLVKQYDECDNAGAIYKQELRIKIATMFRIRGWLLYG